MNDREAIRAARANGWVTHPMYDRRGNEVAWAAMHGPEIHFQVREEYRHRGIQRNRLRHFVCERMKDFGYLTTRTPHDDTINARFVERCGFTETWRDSRYHYYMLCRLPFER